MATPGSSACTSVATNVTDLRQRSVLFRGGKRAAERELARLVTEQESSPAAVPQEEARAWGPSTTINQAIEGWRENGWADLSPKTVRGYEEIWERYVRDTIGLKRIAMLNAYEVEQYFRRLKDQGAGRDTVRRVRVVIGRACRLAAKWSGGTLTNPVANTELPSWPMSEQPDPVRAPEVAEVQDLIRAAADFDERFGAFVHLAAATGMRRGEACAIRWTDINWKQSTIRVDKSIVAAKGGAMVKDPKTKASIRTVSVGGGTLAILKALRSSQVQLAKLCEVPFATDGFVFSTEPGGGLPPHPEAMSHTFIKVRRQAGHRQRCPSPLAEALSGDDPRPGHSREPEAGTDGLVDGPDGPSLHRRHRHRGPAGCRARRPGPRRHQGGRWCSPTRRAVGTEGG